MTEKKIPFTQECMEKIIKTNPTPFHIYDEKSIRENAKKLKAAFSIFDGFKEYFAVKALPNPFIMKILKDEGFGADASSLPELLLAEKAGIVGENIMFTSNETPDVEFKKAYELGAIINLDDISHIEAIQNSLPNLPEVISFRYNPGSLKEGNALIGKPEEAKYGFTREQLFSGYARLKELGIKRFGLHTMVASNELNHTYFIETATILFNLVAEISEKLEIDFEFINIGGGIGIPYKPEQSPVSYEDIAQGIKKAYDEIIVKNNLKPIKLFMECGRVITGPYGYLISKVIRKKNIYREYVGLDSCMANLMRPALYGAYHHITVLGKEREENNTVVDVVGSLCENNDKFAVQRKLPKIEIGDIVAIHDAGAHGHAMGFNYNGKLRSAELLYRTDGSVIEIRRAETVSDYFATLDFSKLNNFN